MLLLLNIGEKTKKDHYYYKSRKAPFLKEYARGKVSTETLRASEASYAGMLKHFNSYGLMKIINIKKKGGWHAVIIPAMVDIFASLVRAGRRTIESLPAAYQEPVRERFNLRS